MNKTGMAGKLRETNWNMKDTGVGQSGVGRIDARGKLGMLNGTRGNTRNRSETD